MADRPARCYLGAMASFLGTFIVPIAVAAVAVVLLLGLLNMMRGGSPNRSQKLMRLRVLLQFVAIVIIMITVWATGH
jgi:NADH:ubiquinone oxidoreductase subunit 6 (subunit J)